MDKKIERTYADMPGLTTQQTERKRWRWFVRNPQTGKSIGQSSTSYKTEGEAIRAFSDMQGLTNPPKPERGFVILDQKRLTYGPQVGFLRFTLMGVQSSAAYQRWDRAMKWFAKAGWYHASQKCKAVLDGLTRKPWSHQKQFMVFEWPVAVGDSRVAECWELQELGAGSYRVTEDGDLRLRS